MRICVERAYGAHADEFLAAPRNVLQALEAAPLESDAAGMAILACLGPAGGFPPGTLRVREEGHAISASPLPGRTMIAAPIWYCSTAAGAVALLAGDRQMKSAATRARYVTALMDSAAAMSGHLTRSGARRAG